MASIVPQSHRNPFLLQMKKFWRTWPCDCTVEFNPDVSGLLTAGEKLPKWALSPLAETSTSDNGGAMQMLKKTVIQFALVWDELPLQMSHYRICLIANFRDVYVKLDCWKGMNFTKRDQSRYRSLWLRFMLEVIKFF